MSKITVKDFLDISGSIALLGSHKEEVISTSEGSKTVRRARTDIYTGFKLRKLLSESIRELKEIEETRQNLIKSLSPESTDGVITIPKEKVGEFNAAWEKILREEVALPNVKLNIKELALSDLSAIDLANLDKIIDFENGEGSPDNPSTEQ